MSLTACPRHVDPAMDRMDPGRTGIRHDDAGGPQNRQTTNNPQPAIEGFFGELFTTGNRHGNFKISLRATVRRYFADRIGHHLAGHRVNRRLAR